MKSYLSLIFLLIIFAFVIPLKSYADVSCQPIYGGGQSCVTANNILLDKKVLNPQTNKFVDNLSINDPKYHPDFITTFKLSVTNTSDKTISKIQIKDIFPQYVIFSSGPGTFDENSKTLSFSIQDLKAQESKTFTIMGRVASVDQISINPGSVVCIINQALARTNTNEVTQDNSQFCIEKKTTPVTKGGFPVLSSSPIKTAPATGPESLVLFSLIPTGIAGFALRKFSSKTRKEQI